MQENNIIALSRFQLTDEEKESQEFIENFIKQNQELMDLIREIEIENDRNNTADLSFHD